LGYEAADQMRILGIGISTSVGIGGDPITGSSYRDILERFESDSETKVILMIGEIGGPQEVEAGGFSKNYLSKPLIAYIAGLTAPEGKRMGHAGAIISSVGESAAEKISILKELGVTISESPAEMGRTVAEVLTKI
jgi:malate-CoA ligase subunit alpha